MLFLQRIYISFKSIGERHGTQRARLRISLAHAHDACTHACTHHSKISQNLLNVFAHKNMNLSRRIFYTSPKTIRGKLLSYLSAQAIRRGSNTFTIPFNRQELADYLGVDRSALSNELSKMQKEGILETHRSKFVLKE